VFHAPQRITNLVAVGDTLYFSVDTKLAKITNSDAAPDLFADTGQPVIDLKPAGSRLVFTNTISGANGLVLGSSDGASANVTSLITSVNTNLLTFKDQVYFLSGSALYRSDGTPGGTRSVKAGVNGG